MGADLLLTDQRCQKAWSVQVKTNSGTPKFWLVGGHTGDISARSHVYVFVNVPKNAEKPPKAQAFRRFTESTFNLSCA